MSRPSVPGAFRRAQQRAGVTQCDSGLQTLRHASATPRLDAGGNRRALQRSLGHTRLATPWSLSTAPSRAKKRPMTVSPPCCEGSGPDHQRGNLCRPRPRVSRAVSPPAPRPPQLRTGHYGHRLDQCPRCGGRHRVHHADGHRHGPPWQHHQTWQWRHPQRAKQRPGPPFLRTFPVPDAIRACLRSSPRPASQAMFPASSAARKRRAQDARCIGTALPGFTGSLPTWGRQRQYPPPSHAIVPGGGRSTHRDAWLPSRAHCSVPVKALAPVSRALFKAAMPTAGRHEPSDPHVWHRPWNVPSQAHPHGAISVPSLAPSVFQVAISTRRRVCLNDHAVTLTSRTPGSVRPRTPRLDVRAFLRRVLQHGVPAGCMQGRHCGCMHASGRVQTDVSRPLSVAQNGAACPIPRAHADAPPALCCPAGGAQRRVVSRVRPLQGAFLDTGEETVPGHRGLVALWSCQEQSTGPVRPAAGSRPGRGAPGRHQTASDGVNHAAVHPASRHPGASRYGSSRAWPHSGHSPSKQYPIRR